jgi:hypothetical protein
MGSLERYVFYNNNHGSAWLDTGSAAGRHFRSDQNNEVGTCLGYHMNNGIMPIYGNLFFLMSVNYLKYNNGRFFFNGEFTQQWIEQVRNGGRPVSGSPYAWMLEVGGLCGPTKVTLAHFLKTGQDRRGGILGTSRAVGSGTGAGDVTAGDFGGFANDKIEGFIAFGGADEVLKPYNFLIGLYGSGNNAYDPSGNPIYNDFVAYAARLDYAVAANLNIWGSYIYAMRQSNTGTRVAQFNGGLAVAGHTSSPATGFTVPNVPDNYLGWEVDAGVDWKLLEGLTFKAVGAYWQPGPWFGWAYVDHSLGAAVATGGGNLFPLSGGLYSIRPDRTIDPIIGVQGSLLVEF